MEDLDQLVRDLIPAHEQGLHLAPDLPERLVRKVREVHHQHLPPPERILVIYDDTVFGGGADGFVLTDTRLCWKNFLEHARQVTLEDLSPDEVTLEDGRVSIGGNRLEMTGGQKTALAAGLHQLLVLASSLSTPASPPDPMSPRELVVLAREHLGVQDAVHYHPSIPEKKLKRARQGHGEHLSDDEAIAVLYDDTVFGGAKEGWVVTRTRLAWRVALGGRGVVAWTDLDPGAVQADLDAKAVRVDGAEVTMIREDLLEPAATLFREIALRASGGRERSHFRGLERCPWCATRVEPGHRRCPDCGGPL